MLAKGVELMPSYVWGIHQ